MHNALHMLSADLILVPKWEGKKPEVNLIRFLGKATKPELNLVPKFTCKLCLSSSLLSGGGGLPKVCYGWAVASSIHTSSVPLLATVSPQSA